MKYFFTLIVVLSAQISYGFVDLRTDLAQRMSAGQISLSYEGARAKMFNELHLEKDEKGYFIKGVYCDQKFYHYTLNETPGAKIPDPKFMNCEHSWPQSKFSKKFPENVQKTDLHHLYPALSKINSERGNYPFAEVKPGKPLSCDTSELGKANNTGNGTYFEPPMDHKGDLARSMFYFSVRYNLPIDPVQEYYFRQWNILDPVDAKEQKRHEQVYKIQKNRNPFIDEPALANQILDF